MPRHKSLPALTPRAKEIVTLVINSVALGTHDNEAEVGAIAKELDMQPGRLAAMLRKLDEQGWLTVKHDFAYPTIAALRWQNPELSDKEAASILRKLR